MSRALHEAVAALALKAWDRQQYADECDAVMALFRQVELERDEASDAASLAAAERAAAAERCIEDVRELVEVMRENCRGGDATAYDHGVDAVCGRVLTMLPAARAATPSPEGGDDA